MTDLDRIWRHPTLLAIVAVGLFLLIIGTFAVVPETKQAVILRLGAPTRVVNRYHQDEVLGRTGAGLIARIPLIDQIVWIDKRMKDFGVERQEVESADQTRLLIDAYARYRIEDPLRMYLNAGGERQLTELLRPALNAALRNEFDRRPLAATFGPQRDAAMAAVRGSVNRVAHHYGVEVADIRIDRADLPGGAPLEAAYDRMRTAQTQQALAIRTEGYKQAQIIHADADAATAKIYADSFGQDPDFYGFYRAMRSYRHSYGAESSSSPAGSATIALGPDDAYLRAFERRGE
jgi:membrane protease subunit HflC